MRMAVLTELGPWVARSWCTLLSTALSFGREMVPCALLLLLLLASSSLRPRSWPCRCLSRRCIPSVICDASSSALPACCCGTLLLAEEAMAEVEGRWCKARPARWRGMQAMRSS